MNSVSEAGSVLASRCGLSCVEMDHQSEEVENEADDQNRSLEIISFIAKSNKNDNN